MVKHTPQIISHCVVERCVCVGAQYVMTLERSCLCSDCSVSEGDDETVGLSSSRALLEASWSGQACVGDASSSVPCEGPRGQAALIGTSLKDVHVRSSEEHEAPLCPRS